MKIKKILLKYKAVPLSAAGVLLLFFSYPKFSFWPLAWLALIPLLWVMLSARGAKEAFFYGLASGFFFYALLLHWIMPTMAAGGVAWPLRVLALFLLALLLSLEFAVLFLAGWKAGKFGHMPAAFIISSLWVLLEFAKINASRSLVWFPWFILGYTQWNNPAALGVASYGKVYAVSFLLVFSQCVIAGFLVYKNSFKGAAARVLLLFAVLFSAFYYGRTGPGAEISAPGAELKISVLQPSIDLYKKWDVSYAEWIKSRLEKLVAEASSGKAELIIWPENALPGWIDDKELFKWLSDLVKKSGAWHIVGSASRSDGRFISAFLISPSGEITGEYSKRVLVPFGEYVPLRELLGRHISAIGALGEFESGPGKQELLEAGKAKIGMSICYESLFSYLFFDQLARKPDFFANITNDGWYLDTSAPHQHLAAAVFRAAETRKPLVRAANNGISAFISPRGEIESSLGLNEYGTLTGTVEIGAPEKGTGLISGNCAVYLSVLIVAAFLLAAMFI
ncbi:MAG: apolipoprotein N-acyltransferase [Elusimicrobia bacterium CG08_land_8_20_14_0_20_51_18]|nr:MAG: apolipoprotein N-acyltransferase [Elusimicrobia bacterium CG08_land_8_20_14_0_20_51_18]